MRRCETMRITPDLEGQRFGRLLVVARAETPEGKTSAYWVCKCDCGNTVIRPTSGLSPEHIRSCGCFNKEHIGSLNRTHGLCSTRLYSIYSNMISRCKYSNLDNSYRYHDRGISVCDEWLNDFNTFHDWAMANGYEDGLQLDRIDNDGNYCPENCRWITHQEQMNNCSFNKHCTYNGETHTVAEWARITGISKDYIYGGLRRGWSFEDIMLGKPKTPARGKLYEYNGEKHTLAEWSRLTGISSSAILARIKRGWNIEKALTEPPIGRHDVKKDNL